jgi:hypothetical protein
VDHGLAAQSGRGAGSRSRGPQAQDRERARAATSATRRSRPPAPAHPSPESRKPTSTSRRLPARPCTDLGERACAVNADAEFLAQLAAQTVQQCLAGVGLDQQQPTRAEHGGGDHPEHGPGMHRSAWTSRRPPAACAPVTAAEGPPFPPPVCERLRRRVGDAWIGRPTGAPVRPPLTPAVPWQRRRVRRIWPADSRTRDKPRRHRPPRRPVRVPPSRGSTALGAPGRVARVEMDARSEAR